jgi:hypothetical protein
MHKHWHLGQPDGAAQVVCDDHWHRYVGSSEVQFEDSCPRDCPCEQITCVVSRRIIESAFSPTVFGAAPTGI